MSANSQPLIATIYNPQNQSKEALIAGFIARKQKFKRLFRDIRDTPMLKPEQHYLIQGIRGMGKTTFLLRIAYEIENTPEFRERLIPIVFNEEEYGISSLADIWERTAQYLEEAEPSFEGLLDAVTARYDKPDYEQQALDQLTISLRQHDKKLLLLIDNIGDLLKKLDDREGQRLREVLLTVPELRLIGATSVVIEQVYDYGKPFYEFFKLIHLEGLSEDEAKDLFLKLGETYHADTIQRIIDQQPGRIEAIRRLTGGVIRTMVLLFEILVENDSGSVFRDLNVLLDRVTPLYKHRMDDLPTQQQKIVAALATAWDAASAKELAQVVRLESKVVSAQLKQLINNGVVEKVETKTKNHLYRLEERFFNIWYLMRFGRKTDQRVLWLIRFFETMFEGDTEWMQERIDGHLKAIVLGAMDPEASLFLTTAFARIVQNEELEDILKRTTRSYLMKAGRNELAKEITDSKYEVVTKLLDIEQYSKAIELLERFDYKSSRFLLDLASCHLLMDNHSEVNRLLKEIIVTNEWQSSFLEYCSTIKQQYSNQKIFECHVAGIVVSGFMSLSLTSGKIEEIRLEASASEMACEIIMRYFYTMSFGRKQLTQKLANKISGWNLTSTIEFIDEIVVRDLVHLWNNNFERLNSKLIEYLVAKDFQVKLGSNHFFQDGDFLENDYLKLLLAKKQYHTAYNYFQQEEWQLKDRFKPLYYATMYFLQDEYPNEYLRMGPELKETVEDVLAEVAQMAIDYA